MSTVEIKYGEIRSLFISQIVSHSGNNNFQGFLKL